MESLEHNCGNILLTICTNMLIFGKGTFLVLIAWIISTNPIKSQIFIFVTSHFTTLFAVPLGRGQFATTIFSATLIRRKLIPV